MYDALDFSLWWIGSRIKKKYILSLAAMLPGLGFYMIRRMENEADRDHVKRVHIKKKSTKKVTIFRPFPNFAFFSVNLSYICLL